MHASSPSKRAKTPTPTPGDLVLAALTTEPALLQHIASFIPVTTSGVDESTTRASEPTAVVKTIASLCRAIPGLSAYVGPSNEAFWRSMVLSYFDFTVGPETLNVDDECGVLDIMWSEEKDDECDDDEYASWHRHPDNGPIAEWERAYAANGVGSKPTKFFVDDMHYWSSLRTYFNPNTYGFLRHVQQDPSRTKSLWPDHEDAFSLFCDLSLLPHFQSTDKFNWKTRCVNIEYQPALPCFLGRFPTKIVGRGYALLKFCNIAPHFWKSEDNRIRGRWSGFDGPSPPTITCKWEKTDASTHPGDGVRSKDGESARGRDSGDHSKCVERTGEENSVFPIPSTNEHDFERLRRLVYNAFSDWRSLHVWYGEYPGPEICIGSTKLSGRWMGFVSESDW